MPTITIFTFNFCPKALITAVIPMERMIWRLAVTSPDTNKSWINIKTHSNVCPLQQRRLIHQLTQLIKVDELKLISFSAGSV